MLRWYLIQTKPSNEAVALTNLIRQGYEVYLPRLAQQVRRREGWRERIVVLFPRYLFLRLREGTQALAPVRSSVGVAKIVGFGGRYAVVPDHVIEGIRSQGDSQSGLHRIKDAPALKAGAAVRITGGAFEGLEGIFERHVGADRVNVLLRLLGQHASVRVATDFIEPADAT